MLSAMQKAQRASAGMSLDVNVSVLLFANLSSDRSQDLTFEKICVSGGQLQNTNGMVSFV